MDKNNDEIVCHLFGLNEPHDVAMFGVKFFIEKSVPVAIESKVKPPKYGMVTMSSSWVLSITRWLIMSSVLSADSARAAFSPEGR